MGVPVTPIGISGEALTANPVSPSPCVAVCRRVAPFAHMRCATLLNTHNTHEWDLGVGVEVGYEGFLGQAVIFLRCAYKKLT